MTGLSFIDGLAPINRPRGPPGLYPGAVLELYGPAGRSVIMNSVNHHEFGKSIDLSIS